LQQWRVISSTRWDNSVDFEWIRVGCDSGVDLTHMFTQAMYLVDRNGDEVTFDDEVVESLKSALNEMHSLDNSPPVASN